MDEKLFYFAAELHDVTIVSVTYRGSKVDLLLWSGQGVGRCHTSAAGGDSEDCAH